MDRNAQIIEQGFAKGLKAIEDAIFLGLWEAAVDLLKYVGVIHPSQGWQGFTGNTQTSYACGIYMFGRLEGVITQDNWKEPVRRRMLKAGETVYLKNPYEGTPRAVKGTVTSSYNHGLNASLEFLQAYKMPRNTMGMVMTTGTEYSVYLEQVRGADVLTNTFEKAKEVIPRSFKPLPS